MADAPAPALDTPTDLQNRNTSTAADALNGVLADLYALYLKTKNFHWHMSGPHFRDYHLLLDDQAAQILGITDAVAERVRKTGNLTLRSIGDVSRRQSIRDNDAEFVEPLAMLQEVRDDNLALIKTFREARERCEEAGDTPTSSLIDEWIDQAEERAWFLFEAARKA
ncbi:Dps family protein [Sphingomonas morindae]|uniref:DNA starvation/stationary phase protection protein n=1 Tax=Sphingomonas morindae TaxID=1541170 RepID=A0ABY4X4M3_9SPHN|nr:DNA starvation/stationary phase protection protein [Sphingomonas morindae]USI71810.1 DNA starvation/stationary phase protection protein [Sphingomonas morindae]